MPPTDEAFRDALRDVLARSGLSMRALSAAMGRDPGYVAALLDPSRPSRARPTPSDLLSASDVAGISLVELLERLWGIDPERLAGELRGLGDSGAVDAPMSRLSADERARVADFVELLLSRRRGTRGGPPQAKGLREGQRVAAGGRKAASALPSHQRRAAVK